MTALDDIRPMLLMERRAPFDDPGYTFEMKFDGYRVLAGIVDGKAALRTRSGADCTRWYPEVTRSLAGLRGGPHVLDGEVAVLDEIGRSDFVRTHARSARRGFPAGADPVVFCAFDLLVHAGRDIRPEPLKVRKALLAKLLARPLDAVLLVEGIEGKGVWFFDQVLALELEGMVAKRWDSPYLSGERSSAWLKIKRKGAVPPERFRRGPS